MNDAFIEAAWDAHLAEEMKRDGLLEDAMDILAEQKLSDEGECCWNCDNPIGDEDFVNETHKGKVYKVHIGCEQEQFE